MIQKSLCSRCYQAFIISFENGDSVLFEQMQPEYTKDKPIGNWVVCPRKCGGFLTPLNDAEVRLKSPAFSHAMSVTVKELYKAVFGGGLPDEVPKDLDAINALLLVHRVNETILEEVNGFFYLHGLKLNNGFTVHLGGSPHGACIVKITKEKEAANGVGDHS